MAYGVRSVRCFFCNDTATTEIYTLSLHDALPIFHVSDIAHAHTLAIKYLLDGSATKRCEVFNLGTGKDRKSTRLNSSHSQISYAVFCLKKKTHIQSTHHPTKLTDITVSTCIYP